MEAFILLPKPPRAIYQVPENGGVDINETEGNYKPLPTTLKTVAEIVQNRCRGCSEPLPGAFETVVGRGVYGAAYNLAHS